MTLTDSIKQILLSQVKKRVLGIIISKLPFLGYPIIGPIVGFFVGQIVEKLLDEGILQARSGYVIFKVDRQVDKYLETLDEWKKEARPNEKAKNREELIDRARDLIKFK